MFKTFGKAVNEKFKNLAKQETLFVADINGQELWEAYLAAFPEGTNPVYKTNTEHDCNCCKSFIRNLGNVVSIVNGVKDSIWNTGTNLPSPYNEVASKLHDLVIGKSVKSVFTTKESSYGHELTRQLVEEEGSLKTVTWNHFWAAVPAKFTGSNHAKKRGLLNTAKQTLERALTELSAGAAQIVLEMIVNNDLTRGGQYKASVEAFIALKQLTLTDEMLWENVSSPVANFRNSMIGTLVSDLSEGLDKAQAVRKYEEKARAENYMRSAPVVSQSAGQTALAKIRELGLEAALERRPATMADVSPSDVIWACSDAIGQMSSGSIAEKFLSLTKGSKAHTGTDITLEVFLNDVLPKAAKLEVLVKPEHRPNFVALTAPKYKDSGKLFKWDNGFAWSFNGGFTDAIKERVKIAGGNIDAKLRISLAWHNKDDLDIHALAPEGHIHYFSKYGVLDVDMNAFHTVENPVENLSWQNPRDGDYVIKIDQYNKRTTSNTGYSIQMEFDKKISEWSTNESPNRTDEALKFSIRGGKVENLVVSPKLTEGKGAAAAIWGVTTDSYVTVKSVMNSPNFWHGQEVGNKHWFFILEGCVPDEDVRSIYSEYLCGELHEHRKAFETLGDVAKCQPSPEQLSGVGFSATSKATVTVRVTGESNRVYNIAI